MITEQEYAVLEAMPDLELPVAGVEYFEKRTDSWNWFGTERWWECFIVWDNGFDGLMQPVCRRLWRWNGSKETVRTDFNIHLERAELLRLANLDKLKAGITP